MMPQRAKRASPAIGLDRRRVLRGMGGLAAAFTLDACGVPSSPGAPAPPAGGSVALAIDAHCHIFNGRDLPVYGFLLDIAIQNPLLRAIAQPLVDFIATEVEGNAKTFDQERDALQGLTVLRAEAIRAVTSDDAITFVANALEKFVDRRTSFGQAPRLDPRTDENDRFIIFLHRRFGLRTEFDVKTALRPYMVANTRTLAQRIVQSQGLGLDADYIRQFCIWAFELTRYRYEIADDLAGLFGDPDTALRVLAPAIIDLEYWIAVPRHDIPATSIQDQAELMRLIALKQPPGRMVHAFVPFDPWRYLDDVRNQRRPNALEVVKLAVETKGLIGVKLYPAMGFMPTGNTVLADTDFPPGLQALGPQLGAKIDGALALVYQYCDDHHLPIMAHCANSNGVAPGYALRAAPEFWRPVLDTYRNIRLSLGHFGGIWDYYCPGVSPSQSCTPIEQWTFTIGQMMGTYSNLYTDVAYFTQVLGLTPDESTQASRIFANLQALAGQAPLASQLMYGSDWVALDVEPDNASYYGKMRQDYVAAFGLPPLANFLGQNAARFLGLQVGQATRRRLARFYRENGREPPDFDRLRAN
jgi:hypothetical protein